MSTLLEISSSGPGSLAELDRIVRELDDLHSEFLRLRRREKAGEDITINLAHWLARVRVARLEADRVEAIALPLAQRAHATPAD